MSDFSVSVDIQAPPGDVWAVMSDIERWHEWTPSVRGITRWGTGPLAVGTRALVRQPKFPPALWTVTALEPGRGFTWVSRAPGLRVTGSHSIAPTATGSRVTLSLVYAGVMGRLMARWTANITRRYIEMEARGLKERSEAAA